jgi:hypothetical protein
MSPAEEEIAVMVGPQAEIPKAALYDVITSPMDVPEGQIAVAVSSDGAIIC